MHHTFCLALVVASVILASAENLRNVAMLKKASASSFQAPYSADKAVDGIKADENSRWKPNAAANDADDWLEILTGDVTLSAVRVWSDKPIAAFSILGLTAKNAWEPIAEATDNRLSVAELPVRPVRATKIRFVTKHTPFAIQEIELLAAAAPSVHAPSVGAAAAAAGNGHGSEGAQSQGQKERDKHGGTWSKREIQAAGADGKKVRWRPVPLHEVEEGGVSRELLVFVVLSVSAALLAVAVYCIRENTASSAAAAVASGPLSPSAGLSASAAKRKPASHAL